MKLVSNYVTSLLHRIPLHYAFGLLGLSSWILISGIYAVTASYAGDTETFL